MKKRISVHKCLSYGYKNQKEIDQQFLASPNPYVQIFQDTIDGKLKGKSEEEINALFDKAAAHQDKVEKTVKDFIDFVAPYLP